MNAWRARARCTVDQAALFDPLDERDRRSRDGGSSRIVAAVEVCGGCKVRVECLEDATAHRETGVRGGVYLDRGRIRFDVNARPGRPAAVAR